MEQSKSPCKDLYEENLLKLMNDSEFITKQQIIFLEKT